MLKESRIHSTAAGLIAAGYGGEIKLDRFLTASLWVLLDFIEKAEYHTAGDFPVAISFFSSEVQYDIIPVPEGKESLISAAVQEKKGTVKRLLVIENKEQINRLAISDISAYCTVNSKRTTNYFKVG